MFLSALQRFSLTLSLGLAVPFRALAAEPADNTSDNLISGVASYSAGDELSTYFRMIWALLIVLAIMLALYALVKKRLSIFGSKGTKSIRIVEIQPVMPKKSLCLVEVRGKEYLLGIGNDNITMLAELDIATNDSFERALNDSQSN